MRGQEGADPGSVVFDAMDAAASRGADLVLVDTAGRLHTKVNLMEELKKLRRIVERTPGALQEVLLVLDATTGQNGLTQARQFTEAVGVTGVVLTKLDGTAKGGIVLAIEVELGIPVKLVGVGEAPEDLVAVRPRRVRRRALRLTGCVALVADAMFDALSDRFDGIFKRLRGRGKLTDKDIDEVAREIRVALLEADVNVRSSSVHRPRQGTARRRRGREEPEPRAAGHQDRPRGARDDARRRDRQARDELEAADGRDARRPAGLGEDDRRRQARASPQVADGRKPLLVAADLQRPAAVEQLRVLGQRIDVPVFSEPTDPVKVARGALKEADRLGRNVVIVDTAGRLQIDDDLMDELRRIRDAVEPHDTLLVVDAMTGQEAVNVAEAFDEAVGLDGVILTKIDGDARGGAALSVKEVVGKPILFAGTGEKLDDFEPFHPDRMASRILGMGDVLTLIEKAEAAFDEEEAAKAEEKLRKGQFTLEDFLDQMQQVRKMGPLQNLSG